MLTRSRSRRAARGTGADLRDGGRVVVRGEGAWCLWRQTMGLARIIDDRRQASRIPSIVVHYLALIHTGFSEGNYNRGTTAVHIVLGMAVAVAVAAVQLLGSLHLVAGDDHFVRQ